MMNFDSVNFRVSFFIWYGSGCALCVKHNLRIQEVKIFNTTHCVMSKVKILTEKTLHWKLEEKLLSQNWSSMLRQTKEIYMKVWAQRVNTKNVNQEILELKNVSFLKNMAQIK